MSAEIIYLRWLDSALTPEWTHAPSEHTGLSEIETVGYLILEDNKHIQVAQNSFKEYDKYSAIMAIPKSAILERKTLKILKKKRNKKRR